ncbi:hypothetical protein C8A05DRAFT_33301, partial [Staphylotrichum tortipilum]
MEEERTITLDLGSSPDPLIDPVLSPPMMPPSHVKKKSQAAERLFTVLGPPSPRKQTFELDVGNKRSPQRLRVTVEADDDDNTATRNNMSRRRLFQSPTPTPKRRVTPRRETTTMTTTTTTVPLRGLSDDEGASTANATPKRRGRPRKSGTPIPTTRKRPGTPARTRKTGARASASPEKDILTSDMGLETTPRASASPKKATKRKATSPAKENGTPGSQPRKRGRPRKQPAAPADDILLLPTSDAAYPDAPKEPDHAMEEDIWLATMSDQPTPRAPAAERTPEPESQLSQYDEPDDQRHYDWPDMGGGADSYSEAGSVASEQRDDDRDGEDTIMAGEEFTMISIGSLPSMQPNSSVMAPAHDEELGEATSLIIDGALEYLRQSQSRRAEEEAQASAEQAPAATEEVQPRAPEMVPEVDLIQLHPEPQLPPPASPPARRRSPRRATAPPLAKQLAQKTLQQATSARQSPAPPAPPAAPVHHQPAPEVEPQDTSAYDDSFSEIPEAVLTAATPRRYHQPQPQLEPDEAEAEDIQPSIERPSRVNHSNPQSETNRLLTPDETPSPIHSDAASDHSPLSTKQPRPDPDDVDLPSSPPIDSPPQHHHHPGDFLPQHIRRNSTETPADQLSSFTSSNPGGGARDAQAIHLPIPDPQPRPTLSPIVRAGRALQLITSDPPSPPGRDSVLGSPFRGSVPRSTQSPVQRAGSRGTRSPSAAAVDVLAQQQSPARSWLAPLSQVRDFIVRSAQSLSPARGRGAARGEGMVMGDEDDPFGPDPGEVNGEGSVRSTLFSGLRRQSADRDATKTEVHEEQEEALEEEQQQQEEEEEEDIWAFEAQRPTPYAPRTAAARRESALEAPRRGKIPSPWRQKSRRLLNSDELEQYADQNDGANDREASRDFQHQQRQVPVRFERTVSAEAEDEFSMLSQQRQRQAPAKAPAAAAAAKKPDLSAFFSSPALLPDMDQAPGVGVSKAYAAKRPQQANLAEPKQRTLPVQRPQSSGTGLFAQYMESQTQARLPSVSQKRLEIGGRQRSVDLFSPVRKSVERSSPEQAAEPIHISSSPGSTEEARPVAHILQKMDFTPRLRPSGSNGRPAAAQARLASPESPAEAEPAHIPQKLNFTPRRRDGNNTLFQPKPVAPATTTNSLFGNSDVSAFFSRQQPPTQRPRRVQLSDDNDSADEELPAQTNRVPDRAASPSKSSFRSPLKPKTPGRVVEFTSSTLSPLAQAQARAERRASLSPEKSNAAEEPIVRQPPAAVAAASVAEQNKKNPPPSLSPSPSLSPTPSPPPQ